MTIDKACTGSPVRSDPDIRTEAPLHPPSPLWCCPGEGARFSRQPRGVSLSGARPKDRRRLQQPTVLPSEDVLEEPQSLGTPSSSSGGTSSWSDPCGPPPTTQLFLVL
ncbi:hypothetical protein MTO96_022432 [Rhipicephalus appendiculatus]